MYAIICLRDNINGEPVAIPIMKADENGEPGDSMGVWETEEDAQEFCSQHILCKNSQNIILDLDNATAIFE